MSDDSLPPFPTASAPDVQTLAAIAPVARQSVVDAVADRLRGDILAGSTAPGHAAAFRAGALAGPGGQPADPARVAGAPRGARPHRHAPRRRNGRGVLARARGPRDARDAGQGLKLADPAWHELVRSALEIRRILAAEAVALAAERHTDEDIDAIAACAQVVLEHADDPVAFSRADLALHARRLQGGPQRRARAVPQHLRALARRSPAARGAALRRLRAGGAALSDDRRSHPVARRRARAQLGTSLA